MIRTFKQYITHTQLYKNYRDFQNSKLVLDENRRLKDEIQYLKDHFDIKDMLPEKGFCRKEQLDLVEFVETFLKGISTLDINPFLIAGNLLGVYRYRGFIPWDDDIDFGLIRHEYNTLVDYCRKKMPVYIYDGIKEDQFKWIDRCTKNNSDQYILFIYDNQIQISKGTSIIDRKCIDFFSFDYYKDELPFSEYKAYLYSISNKLNVSDFSVLKKYDYIQTEIMRSHYIAEKSSCIYFGLDNMDTFKKMFNNDWIPYDVIFPLRKRKFENIEFWTPNKLESFLKYQYQDYYTYPSDFAQLTHGYWKEYMRGNYITVEFYLVDSFEIFHFIPYYESFRKNGIYAVFVAEPKECNVAGEWFDFESAKKILIDNCLEYTTGVNKNASIAFTTQDAVNLKKYSNATKKVNLSYGYGLIRKSYAFSERVLNGFDYKIVNGAFQKNQLQKINTNTILMEGGLSKYATHEAVNKNEVIHTLGINTDKDILVYFPTYDEECCADIFYKCIRDIKDKYYVVVKMHHVLDRRKECEHIKKQLLNVADLVLEGNYSFENASVIADIIVADAKSGAGMEALYLNPFAQAILLIRHEDVEKNYFEDIRKLGPLVASGKDLKDALSQKNTHEEIINRNKLIEECYGKRTEDYVKKVISQMINFEE